MSLVASMRSSSVILSVSCSFASSLYLFVNAVSVIACMYSSMSCLVCWVCLFGPLNPSGPGFLEVNFSCHCCAVASVAWLPFLSSPAGW